MTDSSFARVFLSRVIALCLATLLASQTLAAQQQTEQPNRSQPQHQSGVAPPPLPSDASAPAVKSQPSPSQETSDALPSAPDPQLAAQTQQQPATPPQVPLGTAAAPAEKPTGVAASRPSGAAIAPAKQRRVRAIFISIALVIAAGVAIGATAGLSRASHSAPQ
jgi:hypothetical protein